MTSQIMSSRQRMLAALENRENDHTPCCFMLFNGLKELCKDYSEFIEKQVEMGLDTYVQIPPRPPVVINDSYNLHGLPVNYHPDVEIEEWIEKPKDSQWPLMIKEYKTPGGKLRAEVFQTDDWRWGNHVPFLDDYIVSRSRKFLVSRSEDLRALRYLLVPPGNAEIKAFKEESQPFINLAQEKELLLVGGWGVGADLIGWVHGLDKMVFTVFDDPVFVQELLEIITLWNQKRMQVVLDLGVDLYIKRAWYENCDFWTPKTYRQFLLPILKKEVEITHQAGAKFGYIVSSNCMPLLEMIAEAGVDVLIGVDPHQYDLSITKEKLAGRVCLWGGVNGHLTVELDTPSEVQKEVRDAMKMLAPGGGFILSPVDNVRELTDIARRNVKVLIEEWHRLSS